MSKSFAYRRVLLLLALMSLMVVGNAAAGAAAAPGNTGSSKALPTLSNGSPSPPVAGEVDVRGSDFTPGGRVFVAIYDRWDKAHFDSRWVRAAAAQYGPNGSQDPALGYVHGGDILASFILPCKSAPMVRAYDEQSGFWTQVMDVSPGC